MTLTTAPLRTAADAVCAREGADVAGLSRGELIALSRDVATLRRSADVLMSQVAGEMERRSRLEDGHTGLAAREGFRSAKEMIARTTGGSMAEAGRLINAGGLLAEADGQGVAHGSPDAASPSPEESGIQASPEGPDSPGATEPSAPPTPLQTLRTELSRAVLTGRIGVDVASVFTTALDGLPDVERTQELFIQALAKAPGLPLHRVRELVWRAQAHADPQRWARREEQQYEARAVTVRDDADGMVTLNARLTPIDAAPLTAVLDAGVRRAMQLRRDHPDSDTRTPVQMRADILTDACRHMLDCDTTTSGIKTTVIVRMSREELETGLGVGEVDGLAQPVSAGVLRQRAADAEIIPTVLGADSEVLDWGRAKRLFTPTQRLALAERDGGCAWCHAPPSWCEAHHIRWWDRHHGLTNMDNGVLLCTRCHHRIHRDGWDIEIRPPRHPGTGTGSDTKSATVWFTPPTHVDPQQRPQAGGRHRYDIAA